MTPDSSGPNSRNLSGLHFGFFFNYDMTYTFVGVFQALARRVPGSRTSGIVLNDRYYQHAVDGLPAGTPLIKFYDLVAAGLTYRPTAEELADFRAFDERHRLARVAYSDRFLSNWRYDDLVPLYIRIIAEVKRYVATQKPDVFIFDSVSSQFSHLIYLILRDLGVPVFIPFHMGIEDLFYVYDNPYFDCEDVWQLFHTMRSGAEQPTAAERQWAEQFIAHVREGGSAYRNIAVGLEARKFSLPSLGKASYYLNYLWKYFRYDRNDPTLPNPLQRLIAVVKLRRNRKKTWRYFKAADQIADDFVFLLLQYEPEIATLVLTQVEQTSFIDIIARQLPIGCRLVVKEHPAMVGQRHWSFFNSMARKYPNIEFVHPSASVKQLATRARVTVTLSGTAILETFILRRPMIFASRSRFGGFGFGVLLEKLLDFGPALRDAPARIPDEADLVPLLSSILRKCARFQLSEPLGNPVVLEPDNLDKIAVALLDKLVVADRTVTNVEG